MLHGSIHIMDFTKVFIKLCGFFFMETYSLLLKNKSYQDKQMELKLFPQYCKMYHISEMGVWSENCNLTEKEDINSISSKLYNGLKELEKQNISEKATNGKTVTQVLALKKQYPSEETVKQDQMIKILELEKQIESITLEKNKLESIIANLHTKLFTSYQDKLDKLAAENMKVPILCKNKETENIRDNNSLSYDHECIYKKKMITLIEKNKLLLEFNELFTGLMDETEENGTLEVEIAKLKERVKVLAEENAQFSTNQLETMENLNSFSNERSGNTSLHLLTTLDNDAGKNKNEHEISNVDTCEVLLKKFNEMIAETEHLFHQQKLLIDDNEKLNKELSDIRKYMIKELISLKCNENSIDFSNKSVNEIFVVLIQTIVSKQKERIMILQEEYERARQRVENEKQEWINIAKCATTMVKELKVVAERFQAEKESIHADYKDQIHRLKHILRKSISEKRIFKRELYKGIRNGFQSLIN